MTTAPPPSRYKVVERGRRLVVIDTTTGREASASPRQPIDPGERPSLLARPEQANFDGRATLATHPLYDLKAPRVVILDPGSAALLQNARVLLIVLAVVYLVVAVVWIWPLIALFAFLVPDIREGARRAATRWLDRFDQASLNSGSTE